MTDILDRRVECQKGPCDRVQQMTESESAEMDQFTLSHSLIVSSRVWSSRMVENRKILKFNSK